MINQLKKCNEAEQARQKMVVLYWRKTDCMNRLKWIIQLKKS